MLVVGEENDLVGGGFTLPHQLVQALADAVQARTADMKQSSWSSTDQHPRRALYVEVEVEVDTWVER